jgi:hypothetical protein
MTFFIRSRASLHLIEEMGASVFAFLAFSAFSAVFALSAAGFAPITAVTTARRHTAHGRLAFSVRGSKRHVW